MRINVYAEELTTEADYVTKRVDGRTFMGIRLWLKSAPELHHTADDDDRSAIVLWIPWTKAKGNDHEFMKNVLQSLLQAGYNAYQRQDDFGERYTDMYGTTLQPE